MKANKKFRDGEEAVSAVIGVILMVAITVAIAATVYVYVSGMIGPGTDTAPTLQFGKVDTTSTETLEVTTADPGNLDWGDIEMLVNGVVNPDGGTYGHSQTGTIDAGQILYLLHATETDLVPLATETTDYTVSFRHTPTNTLLVSYDFVRG